MVDPARKAQLQEALRFLRADPRILDESTPDLISEKIARMPDSRQKLQMERDEGFFNKTVKALYKGIDALGEDAGVSDQEIEAGLAVLQRDATRNAKVAWNTPVGRAVRGGAQTIVETLDAPSRIVREGIARALDLPAGAAEQSSSFHDALEQKAQTDNGKSYQPGFVNSIKGAFDAPASVLAARAIQTGKGPIGGAALGFALGRGPISTGIGALVGGAGPEIARRTGHPDVAAGIENAAFDAGFDPINLLGLSSLKAGTMGALKRLAPTASNAGRVDTALANAEKILSAEFTPATGQKIRRELRSAGVPSEALDRAIGTKNERLMRSQLTIAGLQPAALTEKIAQAVGKPGAGEYLGDKVVDALTTPIQELRSRFRPTIRAGLPFVSHDRPLFKETFTQERQRQRHMDIAERQARATAAQITEHELSQAAVRAPRVAAMRNATQRQAELERAITRAFNSGDNAGKKILNARLTQIFGGRNLPVQGENFLREMSPGASRGGEGVVANVLRGNEILNKGWQTKHLLASPGFTIRNVAEDFSKMIAGRVTPSDLWDSASTVRAAEKGNLVAKARLQRIIDSGVDLGDSLRQDFSRLEGRHEAERKMAALYNAKVFTDPGALAALDRGVSGLSVINEKLPAWTLMNRKALNKWEKIARTAMWERSVAQGLPDVLAAERQAKLLFDYGRRFGPNDRYIKNVFSFVPYKTQAPAAAAQLLAENPAAVNAMLGIGRAMEPRYRKGETQAPEWQSRMGVTMRMPNALTDLRRMGVRDPKSAIMDGTYGILPIAPINELVQPLEFGEAALSGFAPGMSFRDLPSATAEGGLAIDDEFMKNLLPNLQDIAEPFVLKRRILTGEPIKKGNEVPELLSRVLGRFSPSQGLDLAIERGLNAHNDAAWPDRFIGRYDKEALDAYNDLPFWAMNQFFPGKLTQPTHTQRLKNLTNSRDLAKVRAIFEVDQDDKPTREIKKEFQR